MVELVWTQICLASLRIQFLPSCIEWDSLVAVSHKNAPGISQGHLFLQWLLTTERWPFHLL